MNFIVTTPKLGSHIVWIDDKDEIKIKDYIWTLWTTKRHSGIYVIGYTPGIWNKSIRLHRLIMDAQPGQIVDHINGDPLDNRRSNLRIVTSTINNQNAKKRKDGLTSKHKGVCKSPNGKKWRAQVQVNRKKKALGYFDTEEEARAAYVAYCQEHGVVLR